MISIERNVSLASVETIRIKEIPMRLRIPFTDKEIFNHTQILIDLSLSDLGRKFLNLLWFKQKEVSYAISPKHFHALKKIIIVNLNVDSKNIIIVCLLHV